MPFPKSSLNLFPFPHHVRRPDAFELWYWRRLLSIPWTARRSNHSILKEISAGCSLEWLMLKLKLHTSATWCEELTHWKRLWCWEGLGAGGEGDDRGWDGWMASPTQWTWVSVNSRSLLKLISIQSVTPSSHLILCCPLLLLTPIPPSIRVFSNESVIHIRWPKYWCFSFNISPSSEHPALISFRMDWLDLLAVQGTLKSLLQHHSSKASILQRSAFFLSNTHIRTWLLEKPKLWLEGPLLAM